MRVDQANVVAPRPRAASEPGSGVTRLASQLTGAANAQAGLAPRPLARSKSVGSLPSLGGNVMNVASAAPTPHAQGADRAATSRPLHHPVEIQGVAYDRVRADLPEALRAKLDRHYTDSSFSTWHLGNLAHVMAVLRRPGADSNETPAKAYDACLQRLAGFLERVPPYSVESDGFMKQLEDLANFVMDKVGDPARLVASYKDGEARDERERMSPAVRQAVDKRIDAVIAIGERVTLGSSKLDTLSSALYMCSASTDTFRKLTETPSGDARIDVPNDVRLERGREAAPTPDSARGRPVEFSLDDGDLPESYADLKKRKLDIPEQGGPYDASKRIRRRSI